MMLAFNSEDFIYLRKIFDWVWNISKGIFSRSNIKAPSCFGSISGKMIIFSICAQCYNPFVAQGIFLTLNIDFKMKLGERILISWMKLFESSSRPLFWAEGKLYSCIRRNRPIDIKFARTLDFHAKAYLLILTISFIRFSNWELNNDRISIVIWICIENLYINIAWIIVWNSAWLIKITSE